MSKNKTTENELSVTDFLNSVNNDQKKLDSAKLSAIITEVTGYQPKMWGNTIVGFGSYHYQYESKREGDAPIVGFSPRKDTLVLYLYPEFKDKDNLLSQLGKHKTGKACIYIKKLSDIDLNILKKMIEHSTDMVLSLYP